jgi:hypothetical protein
MEMNLSLRQAFLQRSERRIKTSGMMTAVSDLPGNWGQECYDALVQQHPWIAQYRIIPSLTTSAEKTAVGFFHVTQVNLPASANSRSDLNSVTIPIIIKEGKAFPFDVYSMNDVMRPLNRERVERDLRVGDIFSDVKRDETSTIEAVETVGTMGRGHGWGPAANLLHGGTGKYSSAKQVTRSVASALQRRVDPKLSELRRETVSAQSEVIEKWSSDLTLSPLTARALDGAVLDAKDTGWLEGWAHRAERSILKQSQMLGGVEARVGSGQGIEVRSWWVRNPTTGDASISAWEKVSSSQFLSAAGEKALSDLLESRHVFVGAINSNREKISYLQERPNPDSMMYDAVSVNKSRAIAKEVSENPNTWVHCVLSGFSINELFGNSSSSESKNVEAYVRKVSPNGSSKGTFYAITKDGILISPESYSVKIIKFIGTTTTPPEIKSVCIVGQQSHIAHLQSGSPSALVPPDINKDEPVVVAAGTIEFSDSTFVSEGETAHPVFNTESTLAVVSNKYARPHCVYQDDYKVMFVPSTWRKLPVQFNLGDNSMSVDSEPVTETQALPDTATIDEIADSMKDSLQVEKSSGGYILTYPSRNPFVDSELRGEKSRMLAKASMSLLALAEHEAEHILQRADRDGIARVKIDQPNYEVGQVKLAHALNKLQSIEAAADQVVRDSRAMKMALSDHGARILVGMDKTSTFEGVQNSSISVDAVLSLGFLTRRTIDKFVAALPALQEAQSRVCAMLLASRLGLHEIPEDACETVIQAMEPILRGLRSVSFSLSQSV